MTANSSVINASNVPLTPMSSLYTTTPAGVPTGKVVDGSALESIGNISKGPTQTSVVTSAKATDTLAKNTATISSVTAGQKNAQILAAQQKDAADKAKAAADKAAADQAAQKAKDDALAAATTAVNQKKNTSTSSGFPEVNSSLLFDENKYNSLQTTLTNATATLDELGKSMIASIQQQYELRKTQMQQTNAESLGALRVMGYRSGRAQYAPELQNDVLTTEERAGIMRLSELDAAEQNAILTAKSAITKEQYNAAQDAMTSFFKSNDAKLAQIKELHSQALDFDKWAVDKQLKMGQITELAQKNADAIMSDWAVSGKTPSAMEFADLGSSLGITAKDASNLFDAKQSLFLAKDTGAMADAQKKLLDVLHDIPAGQEVTFPDGTKYKGLGDAGDYYMSIQTNDNGYSTLVKYNKQSGEISYQGLGNIGRSSAAMGSGGYGLTPGEQRDVKAFGFDVFSPPVQNLLIQQLSTGEQRRAFHEAFAEASKPGNVLAGVDPSDPTSAEAISAFFLKWVTENIDDPTGVFGNIDVNAAVDDTSN